MFKRLADVIAATLAVALLLPIAAIAGDEDRGAAYMIYIDPETGKYTTLDPELNDGTHPTAEVRATESPRRNTAVPDPVTRRIVQVISAAAVALVLVAAGMTIVRRRAG